MHLKLFEQANVLISAACLLGRVDFNALRNATIRQKRTFMSTRVQWVSSFMRGVVSVASILFFVVIIVLLPPVVIVVLLPLVVIVVLLP